MEDCSEWSSAEIVKLFVGISRVKVEYTPIYLRSQYYCGKIAKYFSMVAA